VGEREGALLVLQQDNIYIQCGGGGTAVVVAAAAAAAVAAAATVRRRCCCRSCCHRRRSCRRSRRSCRRRRHSCRRRSCRHCCCQCRVVVAPAAAVVVAAGAAGVVAAAAARSRVRLAGPLVRVRPSLFCLWYLIVKAQLVFDIVFGTHLCIWVKKTCKICNSECFLTCMGRRDSGGDEEECTRARTAIFGCVTV